MVEGEIDRGVDAAQWSKRVAKHYGPVALLKYDLTHTDRGNCSLCPYVCRVEKPPIACLRIEGGTQRL